MLKELDLTEGRGTSISKIIGAMRENGSPAHVFEFDEENHDYFLVTVPVHLMATSGVATGEVTPHVTDQVEEPSEKGGASAAGEVTGEVARLLAAVEGEMRRVELRMPWD